MLRKKPEISPSSPPPTSSSTTEKQVAIDPEATQGVPRKVNHPLFKKIWYGLTAFFIFLFVITALITASFVLNLQTCGSQNSKFARNSAIATIIFASIALIADIGFVALQIRRKRRAKKAPSEKEKKKSKTKKRGQKDVEIREEEEAQERSCLDSVEPSIMEDALASKSSNREPEIAPSELQKLLKEMSLPNFSL